MHKRHDAQRQHIIDSVSSLSRESLRIPYSQCIAQFHNLLFHLHAVSFFLAPSLVPLVTRAICCQFLCYKPREVDPKLSLRAWFLLTFILNTPSFWLHAREGTIEGRTVVLDFVGMGEFISNIFSSICENQNYRLAGYAPSKAHLVLLDVLILLFQLLLATLTYEKSLQQSSSMVSEVLLPHPLVPTPSSRSNEDEQPKPSRNERTYIIDVRFAPLINRIRQPAPEVVERPLDVLPLPNTSNLPTIPRHFRALMRIGDERRRPSLPEPYPTASDRHEVTEQRLPGSMGMEDTD